VTPPVPVVPDVSLAAAVAECRAQFDAIARRLDAGAAGGDREVLKRDIVALFRQVDGALTGLGQLKEEIRGLVDRYKQGAAATHPAPEFTGRRPAVHADHIGASTFVEKGWSLISLGDHAGAIKALTRALELAPDTTEAQSLLGWAQMLHEDYDDALATFSRVLMKEPANTLARINVGYICLKKRIFGEAIEHLSKAIRLDNDRKATLYAHYYLGLVYYEREMYEDAQAFFRKTLQLGPNLIEAYFDLGRTLWFSGSREAALATWEAGHQANRFNPWAKRCQEMLALAGAGGEIPRHLS
jgi:tetratricopeptide (TPR) repeat protein